MAPSKAPSTVAKSLCDGKELFDSPQAARFLNVSEDVIRQATMNGGLCPARVGRLSVFTRRDLQRFRRTLREHAIVTRLVEGAHPLDIFLEHPGRYPMKEVTAAMLEWSRVSGVWLVEGPRGSYARWLERFGLLRCTPRELRRLIEALCRDPELGERVRRYFQDYRGRGAELRELP